MPVLELTAYWGSRVYDAVPNTHHKINGREVPGAKAPQQRGDREEEVKFEPCVQVGGVSRQQRAGERGERHQAEETQQGCVARSLVSPGWAGWAGVAETEVGAAERNQVKERLLRQVTSWTECFWVSASQHWLHI